CPGSTVSRRLARARELLRARLTRRGLALPAGVLGLALSRNAAPAALPAPLASTAVRAALLAGSTRAGSPARRTLTAVVPLTLSTAGVGAFAQHARERDGATPAAKPLPAQAPMKRPESAAAPRRAPDRPVK